MARRIDKLPGGKYAVWSTIVDGYILEDVTPEEIIDYYSGEERERIVESVNRQIARLENE
ncbi:hypothetical protein PaecuDRAFT_3116 [Paenibacillus curdlanolyticus YK9]|uniref:Uncharacterized protein n=1 Tax=Paenibacillus curdlanolyticus YK9 TaxID=717606 RepID=E0IBS7_9BACL|nr:hypothetical protein [Paenibacillus curdlanolyticus]EFM10157.1 hypothetical protein PaecuDRAFT_3116 [Paenibacillus curdlanolyticus YK9]